MIDQQDAFTLFVRYDLRRSFEVPRDTPRELLTLVDQIVGPGAPIRT